MDSKGPTTKILAVLYTDQVGSTAMAQALGDRLYDEVRHELEDAVKLATDRHGGSLIKSTGDGAMIVYESASDAIAAAITLQSEISRVPPREGQMLQMRIGLAVGDVSLDKGDCFGTPVVEAARLESAAPAGGILCTDLVRVLAGSRTDATFDEHPPVEAKGFDAPIVAWQVPWREHANAGIVPESIRRSERISLAGREPELEIFREAFAASRASGLQAVLVAGEPGVGKSRLTREAAREAAGEGAIVLHGRSDENMGRPYQPFAEILSTYLRIDPEAATYLGPSPGELANLLPEITDLAPVTEVPLEGDPETVRFRLFSAIAGWIEQLAHRKPVFLILDDIHWSDQGTGQLLRHLLRSIPDSRVLVAATYRDTEPDGELDLTQLVRDLRRLENVRRVKLEGLDTDAVRQLLSAVGRHADEKTAERIRERTGGNAYFTGEVVLGLSPGDDEAMAIPDAVRDVIIGRVARLSDETREVLEVASVVGRIVSVKVVCEVLGKSFRSVAESVVEAASAGLITELSSPPLHLQFVHALTQTSMYSELSALQRSVLHGDVAASLEKLAGDDTTEIADRLAAHYAATQDPADVPTAIHWYREAARRDSERAADSAAASHLRRAVGLLDRNGIDDPRLRCELLVDLGDELRRARLDGARSTLIQAGELAKAHAFDDLLVRAAVANTRGFFSSAGATDHDRVTLLRDALAVADTDAATRARLLSNLSVELTFEIPFEERLAISDEAVELARGLPDRDHLFHVLGMRYGTLWTASGLDERIRLSAELRELADELDRDHLRYVAGWSSFQAAMESGDFDLADEALEMQARISKDTPTQQSYLLIRQALRAIVRGDLGAAEQMVKEAFDDAVAAGEPDAFAFYVGQTLNIRYHQGRMDEVLEMMEAAVEASPGIPAFLGGLALIHVEAGRLEPAAEIVDDLGSRWRDVGDELNWLITMTLLAEAAAAVRNLAVCAELHPVLSPYRNQFVDNATNWFGSVHRHLALLEHALGRFDEADASFRAAIEAHSRLPAPLMLARSELGWAESLLQRPQPQPELAMAPLRSARDAASRFGLGAVQRRCDAALASIDG